MNVKKQYSNHRMYLVKVFCAVITLHLCSFTHTFAHKVSIFAYVEGDVIHSQSYFPDGRTCKNAQIEVFDLKGKRLLKGATNMDGEFSFRIPIQDSLKLVLTAGMAHKAEYEISKEEISPSAVKTALEKITQGQKAPLSPASATVKTELSPDHMRDIIDKALEKKLKPVMQKLTRIEAKNTSINNIMGGIGYILGLMGIVMYFKKNRKDR